MVKRRLLVLESVWSEDLTNSISVKPFIDGWAALTEVDLTYRTYHDKRVLQYWLREFVCDSDLKVCYIAGHSAGAGGRLGGLVEDINVTALGPATKVQGPEASK